jgi:hypothetical protein
VTQPLIDLRNADAPRSSRSRPHQGLVAVTLVGMLALLFLIGFSDFGANPKHF